MERRFKLITEKLLDSYIRYSIILLIISTIIISVMNFFLHKKFSNVASTVVVFVLLLITGFIRYSVTRQIFIKSHTDALTGLKNRMYFYYIMPYYLKKLENKDTFLFAMLDIDHFKDVNDKDGHNAGDILIKEVATILKENLDCKDEVIRYGGDEFCIILPNTSIQDGYMAFENIRDIIYEKYNNNYNMDYIYKYNHKYNYYITVSVGLISIEEYLTVHKLTETADKCLYKAKENRNKVIVLD